MGLSVTPAFADDTTAAAEPQTEGGFTLLSGGFELVGGGDYSVTINGDTINYILLSVPAADSSATYEINSASVTPTIVLTAGANKIVKLAVPAGVTSAALVVTSDGSNVVLSESLTFVSGSVAEPAGSILYGEVPMSFSEFNYDVTAAITNVTPGATSFDAAGTVTTPEFFIAEGGRADWPTTGAAAAPKVDVISSATFGDTAHFLPTGNMEINYADVNSTGAGHAAIGIKAVEVGVSYDLIANAQLLASSGEATAQSTAVLDKVTNITYKPEAQVYKAKYLFPDATWGLREATAHNAGAVQAWNPITTAAASYGGSWTIREVTVNFDLQGEAGADFWTSHLEYLYGGYVENLTTGHKEPLVFLQNIFTHRGHTNFEVSLNDAIFARMGDLDFPDNYKIVVYAYGYEDIVIADTRLASYTNANATIEQGTTFNVKQSDPTTWFDSAEPKLLHIQQVTNLGTVNINDLVVLKGTTPVDPLLYTASIQGSEIEIEFTDAFFTAADAQGSYTIKVIPDTANVVSKPLAFTINKWVDRPTLQIRGGSEGGAADTEATALNAPISSILDFSNADFARTFVTSGRSVSTLVDVTDNNATVAIGTVLKRDATSDPYYLDLSTLIVGHTYRLNVITTNYSVGEAGSQSTTVSYYFTADSAAPRDFDGEVITLSPADAPALNVDIPGSSTKPGTHAIVFKGQTTANQRFRLEADTDGYYTIINIGSGLALDVSGSKAGGAVIQYASRGTDNQKWSVLENADGSYTFVSKLSNTLGYALVLDVSGSDYAAETGLIAYEAHGSGNQKFIVNTQTPLVGLADDSYFIKSSALGGGVLDVAEGSQSIGAPLIVFGLHGGENQQFDIAYDAASGYYTITNVKSGLSLDLFGSFTLKGTPIVQWTGHGSSNQLWAIVANTDGSYTITSARSGNALAVNGLALDGAKVLNWPLHNGASQKWAFDLVP